MKTAALAVLSAAVLMSVFGCGGDDAPDTGTDTDTDTTTTAAQTFSISFTLPAETDNKNQISDGAGIDYEFDLDDATLYRTRLSQTMDLGADYTDRFLFVCDHITYGLRSLGMLDAGRTTDQVVTGAGASFFVTSPSMMMYLPEEDRSLPLTELVSERKPEYILLAVGAADVGSDSKPSTVDFRDDYIALIESVKEASPDSIIICMSVLPGSRSSGFSIYDAESYNKMILSAAAATEVYYLDAASAFAASSGYLREDCDGGSSRLSTTGLLRLLEVVRTHHPVADTDDDKTE